MRRAATRVASWVPTLLTCVACVLVARSASAQNDRTSLLVLRTEVGSEAAVVASEVDRALSHALSRAGSFGKTYFSPTPYEEIELAAGCNGTTAECLRRVSATLEADWVLVRELKRDDHGGYELTLVAQDGTSPTGVRRALARVAQGGDASPEQVVPQLIESLYPSHEGDGAPTVPSGEPGRVDSPEHHRRVLPVIGWSTIAAASAMVSSGVAVGIAATADRKEYADLDVKTAMDADRAVQLRTRAAKREDIANGLLLGGAAAGAAGAAMLLWDLLRGRTSHESHGGVRVSASTLRGGGMIRVSGPLGAGGSR